MEFHILGPVHITAHSRQSRLRGDLERRLLAHLALKIGRPVSVDALMDRLWDGRLTPSTQQNLHSHVSRLRGIIRSMGGRPAEAGAAVIKQPPGYMLDAAPETVDWHRFLSLCRRAESLAVAGRAEEAAARWREADRLWPGEPLLGLGGSWPERDMMAARRRAETAKRMGVELALHRFPELIAELTELVAERPADETLVGYLMTAYYACGRRTDALHLYNVTRRTVPHPGGGQPDGELERIHRLILERAPAEDVLAPLPRGTTVLSSPGTKPLYNLPRHSPLIGRESEMRQLMNLVDSASRDSAALPPIVLVGMAGVGKTALAYNAADRLRDRFPDGQLYLDLRAHADVCQYPLDTGPALARLLQMFGVETIPSDLEQRKELWWSVISRHRAVVIMDDAGGSEQVRPLLPPATPALLIITSQRSLPGLPGARQMTLGTMPLTDSVRLFRSFTDEERARDTQELGQIVELCGNLPLAVEIVANRFGDHPSWSLSTLRRRLEAEPGRLREIRDSDRNLARAFQLSYRDLTSNQRSGFRRISLHLGTEFGPHAVAALLDCSLASAERLLEELLQRHLLQEPAPDRYRFHALLRRFARHQADTEDGSDQQREALDRLVDFYLLASERADRLLHPRRPRLARRSTAAPWPLPSLDSPGQASSWFTTERSNLVATERYARSAGAAERAALLSHAISGFLDAECQWVDTDAMHQHAVEHWSRTGRRTALCLALLNLAAAHSGTGRYAGAESVCRQALDIARDTGDPVVVGAALRALGTLNWHLGRNEQALAFHQEALRLHERTGDEWERTSAQHNVALSYCAMGEFGRALEHFESAIDEFRRLGDLLAVTKAMDNLAGVHAALGHPERARRAVEESLATARSIGNRLEEAVARGNLAGLLTDCGDAESAVPLFTESLAAFRRINDRRNIANTLTGLASAQYALGRYEQAHRNHREARDLARAIGAATEEALALFGLGQTEVAMGRFAAAAGHLKAAKEVADRIHLPKIAAAAQEALRRLTLAPPAPDSEASPSS